MRPIAFFLLVCLPVCLKPAPAATPADELPNPVTSASAYDITGTVVDDVSTAPVPGAQVTLTDARPNGATRSAVTNSSGAFVIPAVPVGVWDLGAAKPGYADGPDSYRKVILVGGTQPSRFTLRILPEATISGTVRNPDNVLMVGATVTVLRPKIVAGHRVLAPRDSVKTDERGVYLLKGLGPGPCYVVAGAKPTAEELKKNLAYEATFYPNSTDPGTAQSLDLRPGARQQAEIRVTPTRGYQVTGKLPAQWTGAVLTLLPPPASDAASAPVSDVEFAKDSPAFRLLSVPTGNYTLRATARDRFNREVVAYRQISVADNNLADVVLYSSESPRAIKVVYAGDSPKSNVINSVTLQSAFQSYTVASNNFRLTNPVAPGRYRIAADMDPAWYLKSATLGSRDLIHGLAGITDEASLSTLELGVSNHPGIIEATVTWPDTGSRVPARVVVLERNNGEFILINEVKVAPPNEPAVVRPALIGGLPPGNYVLYAWPDPVAVEYSQPDALRAYDAFAQSVTVGEGEQVRAALKIALNP